MTEESGTIERRIVVGVDGSSYSERALHWAAFLGASLGARLEAVSAWDYPAAMGWAAVPPDWSPQDDMKKVLQDTIHKVFGDHPPAGLTADVREGGAAKVLVQASEGAGMLVVGSRGHGGFVGLLLGSVSANVAEHARCPVLIVHGHQALPPLPAVGTPARP
jgi:nucleotide-binding universal stress UspA family protein